MRIGILGMGGIGGFVGAKLARTYSKDPDTQIIFICRGKTKKEILNEGLKFISPKETVTVQPDLTSDDPREIGWLDLLIVATKSYALADAVRQYESCLQTETVILPLLNGINARDIIAENIPYNGSSVLHGCIYIASNIDQPGVVRHLGGPGKIFFGNDSPHDFTRVQRLLEKGGLDTTYTRNIKDILWKKFLFVSPLAAVTTAHDISFGELSESQAHMDLLENLMREVKALAGGFGLGLKDKDIAEALDLLPGFPNASKTSLQLDVQHRAPHTERDNLIGFVIDNGERLGIEVKHYKAMDKKINEILKSRR